MILREHISKPLTDSFVKVVVDVERRVLALGCEVHVDCAEELMGDGSRAADLWGANFYPDTKAIEFTSLINIRPKDGNRSLGIQLPEVRKRAEEGMRTLLSV